MAFDFPANPTENQEYTPPSGVTYVYRAPRWTAKSGTTVVIADAAPPNPVVGQTWWESDTGNFFVWYNDGNSQQWVQINSGPQGAIGPVGPVGPAGPTGGVPEAPTDGKQYVRKNGAWVETPFMFDTNGDAIVKFGATIVVRIKSTGLILTKDDIEVFSVSV